MIHTLATETYLDGFNREHAALARASEGALHVPVPSCPGWTVATLLAHLGGAYAYVSRTIVFGEGDDVLHGPEDLGLPPDIERWFRDDRSPQTMPSSVLPWFVETGHALTTIFQEIDASLPAWTWWRLDHTVGFWLRRMTNETAIHRWDVQSAMGSPHPIDVELARDGIDEMMDIYLPRWCRPKSTVTGSGETYRIERSDGEEIWVIEFEGEGMAVSRENVSADVTLRGSVSDLLLFLWRRLLPDRLEVDGDLMVLGRYFDLVPPD